MTEESEFPFALLSALFIGYISLCGILWHLGYWSTFRFNFLEYANVSDLFKSTVYPFFSRSWIFLSIILFSCGISYGQVIILRIKHKNSGKEFYIPTKFQSIKHSSSFLFIDLFIMVSGSFAGIFALTWGERLINIVAPLIGIFVGLILTRLGFLDKYFKDDILRVTFVLTLTVFASFNFSIAKKIAIHAEKGLRYKRVHTIKSLDKALDTLILNKPYLGSTEKYSFILIGDNNVMVVNNDQINFVSIQEYINEKRWIEINK